MDPFALTRSLIDIESVTGREKAVGEFLLATLTQLAASSGGKAERMEVSFERFNVLATWGRPIVTLSTHMDTVPPFFPSSEDEELVRGRGACDAKGIIAAIICAAEQLLAAGTRDFALLFVVGEEKDSLGALCAAENSRGSKFVINGEPTENKLALGSKGALRYVLSTRGRLAHSAYEASADLMFRTVGDPEPIRAAMRAIVTGRGELQEMLHTPALHLEALEEFETTVVAYTTDIPNFAGAWGRPFLIGPGSIHVAHTAEERISKQQLLDAIAIYARMTQRLIAEQRWT
jgi:acetylornithine deacetylase